MVCLCLTALGVQFSLYPPPRPRNVPVTHLRAGSRKTVYQCFPFKAPVTAAGTEAGW